MPRRLRHFDHRLLHFFARYADFTFISHKAAPDAAADFAHAMPLPSAPRRLIISLRFICRAFRHCCFTIDAAPSPRRCCCRLLRA